MNMMNMMNKHGWLVLFTVLFLCLLLYLNMDIGRKSDFIQIPYRDDKIIKKLSLDLNNEHDALFYESYMRLPLDNRNYMASLYAREQERGVNDSTGHRIQELALVTPKEDTVLMREKRNAEMDSLNESKKYYEDRIKEIRAKPMGSDLNATEQAEIKEYQKKIDEIKRKIRNIDSTWTKALNSEIFKTGHLSGLNPLTRDALKESLNTISDNLNQKVVDFLEEKFDQLPARDDAEDGSEQRVMTYAAYLAVMCQYLGIHDVSKLSNAIKRFYGLLQTITKDTLTQAAYDDNYSDSVDDIINLMKIIDSIEVPGFFYAGQPDVIVEQMKPVASSIKFDLGRAAYKTYNEADKRHLPNWNTIKAILDGSNFKQLYSIGNEVSTFRETDTFNKAPHPYNVLRKAIANAAAAIWDDWINIPSAKNKNKKHPEFKTFSEAINELSDAIYPGIVRYKRRGGIRETDNKVVELSTEYIRKENTLKITKITAVGTELDSDLHDIKFNNWLPLGSPTKLYHPDPKDTETKYHVYQKPTISKDTFISTVTDNILTQLQIDKDNDLPADVMRKLVTKGSGVKYQSFDSPEQKFNNIIDMGNPLKDIRSRRRYK